MGSGTKNRRAGRRHFIKRGVAAGVGATALAGVAAPEAAAQNRRRWDITADVVVLGAGAAGLPAAIAAADAGASVIVVEANFDIGGRQMLNGGQVVLGGGTSLQKKYGIQDSADQVYLDTTNPDAPMTRYNDREMARAFADYNASTYEFLVANGVKFLDQAPRPAPQAFWGVGSSAARSHPVLRYSDDLKETIGGANGSGLSRPLEKSARAKGVRFLLNHRMTSVVREAPMSGRVLGITVDAQGKAVSIGANKGVVIATGGHNNDVNFRRIFDPRLTDDGYYIWGEPFTRQTADGQRAAMAIGGTLWGTANQTNERNVVMIKAKVIGAQYPFGWPQGSPVFRLARAEGLLIKDWQDIILVNQAGRRFWTEDDNPGGRTMGNEASYGYLAAALGSVTHETEGRTERLGGASWAIFDADAVEREKWDPRPPYVDPAGYFFKADTLVDLAGRIRHPHQKLVMSGATLQATVERYNSFVDTGKDVDFGKPGPKYRIQRPPFYAAWATPGLHDCVAGLRTNGKAQVVDLQGKVIAGLYAAGEATGGLGMHGQGRCMVFGRIAGMNAAAEKV